MATRSLPLSPSHTATHTAVGGELITADVAFQPCRAVNVSVSGTIYVDFVNGDTNVPIYVAAGVAFPADINLVYTAGSDAATIAGNITVLR